MNMVDHVNRENVYELLQAQAHVLNHISKFIDSMSLKCALDLGIPDIIRNHGKPMTINELVVALPMLNPAKACKIHRLMRILVHSGIFAQQKLGDDAQEDGYGYGYVLTNASRLLLKGDPLSVGPLMKLVSDPIVTKPLHFLSDWFQNNDPTAFSTAHGKTLWDYCNQDPQLNNTLNEGMASDCRLITDILIDKCKGVFEGLESLVDVGGGTGTVAKAIADVFPHLDCSVFDLPHVVADLKCSKNLKYVGGDMFVEIPTANAVLLKSVLHNWNDEDCLKILKRCKEAISSGDKERRKVIIIDTVVMENGKVGDEGSNLIGTQLCFDMLMMTLNGSDRVEEEWAKLFLGAGFSDYKIRPLIFGIKSLIEVYP